MNSVIEDLVGILRVKFKRYKKFLYPIYRKLYYDRLLEKSNKNFRKNAVTVLDKFDKCLRENNIEYTLAFGTLLGAVREKGFIKHDFDIDTIIWADNYSCKIRNCLESVGFKIEHEFLADNGNLGREETYVLDGVNIDIFYMYPAVDKLPYCCAFAPIEGYGTWRRSMKKTGRVLAKRVELPMTNKVVCAKFEDLLLPIPENADEILAKRYGDDYMTPDPDFCSSNTGVIYWNEVIATYYEY